MDSRSFRENVIDWYRNNGRNFPWRISEPDPYIGLLTEVLLRKTRASQVLNVYDDFLRIVQKNSCIVTSEMEAVLRPLGLQFQRSTAILSIIEDINAKHGCRIVPRDLETLLSLPHVGPYIANSTRCFYFGLPVPIVDSNIGRIFDRFFGLGITGANPVREKAYWIIASVLVDREEPKGYNWGLLDIGSEICKTRDPGCSDCPLIDGCNFAHNRDWQGLNPCDLRFAGPKMWFDEEINSRFAEITGLPQVPSREKIERLGEKHAIRCVHGQVISELQLRYLAVVEYCPAAKEELVWTYSC